MPSNDQSQGNYSRTGADILTHRSVSTAKELLTIVRGQDGKPEVWSTGDQSSARRLFRDAAETLGVNDMASFSG